MTRAKILKGTSLAAVFVLALSAAATLRDGDTTVIVVRHAERARGEGDDSLSAAGWQRARTLADVLEKAGVDAIYTSQLARARLTVEPLAARLGIQPRVSEITPGDAGSSMRRLVERIRSENAGGVIVVAGHSNTVPVLVEALGAGAMPQIPDSVFDNLFVVTLTRQGGVRLVKARYGEPGGSGR